MTLPSTSKSYFSPINIVFVYVNHSENETTELHHFSHFRCNPSAKVGKLLLKLSKGCSDARHPCVNPSATACRAGVRCWNGTPGTFMLLLGRKELPIIFAISWIMYFCNSVTSPTYPLFSPPLVSLFSVNSSLPLYNPCNNPEERASKTLFFLTLIPTDPTLLWFLALLQGISANRSLRSQELALGMYSRGEGDVRITRTQFPRTGSPAVMCSSSRPSAFQSLFLPVHGDFQKEKKKKEKTMPASCQLKIYIFVCLLCD